MKRYHLIGIGGCGMAGLAELLHAKGYIVSGSDAVATPLTASLVGMGISFYEGHRAEQVPEDAIVVLSSAINAANPEVIIATRRGQEICHRVDVLAELMTDHINIVVLGSHGKTTTASLLTSILLNAGYRPSYAIGATLTQTDKNAALFGKFFVAEGDESDKSFQKLPADIAIITNIDADHLSTYNHDIEQLKQAYVDWINTLQCEVIINADDPHCRDILDRLTTKVSTFSALSGDFVFGRCRYQGLSSSFLVNGASFSVRLPGRHNVENATASIAAARFLGLDVAEMQKGLSHFQGVSRRCHVMGEYDIGDAHCLVIEDYGHHPVEVKASHDAIVAAYPHRRVVMVFQPHRYTRTRDCWDEFVAVLQHVDCAVVMPIYAASEDPIEGINSLALCQASGDSVQYLYDIDMLSDLLNDGDILLLQGAGDITTRVMNDVVELCAAR